MMVRRFIGIVALIACASCGKLLGSDEDPPSPEPPSPPDTSAGGGDGSSSSDSAGQSDGPAQNDGAVQNDGAAACKQPLDACVSVADCCMGTTCSGGKCCVGPSQPATAPSQCCQQPTTLLLICGQGKCCPLAN